MIVHDGRSATIDAAKALRNTIFDAFGIKLEVKIASADSEAEKEIVIGNCRPIAEKVVGKLTGKFDFIFRVEPNKLVLYANHSLGYDYLGQYLKEEVFVKGEGAAFIVQIPI